jgi:glutaredoxin
MPIISSSDAQKIREIFEAKLQEPVTVELFTQPRSLLVVPGRKECEYCEQTEQLLGEVAALSDKVELKAHDLRANPEAGSAYGIEPGMVPAFVLNGQNRGIIRQFGIPAGYEFRSLIDDLIDVSAGSTSLSQATRDALAALPSDVHIRVFVTPT